VLEAFERLGHDAAALRSAARVTREQLADPDGLVPCQAYEAMLAQARAARPTPNLALHLARATPIGAYPLLDYLVLSSATLGEGLGRLQRYYRLVGSPTPLALRTDEAPIRVVMDGAAPFPLEFSVSIALFHLRTETNGAARAEWVSFAHRPDDPAEYERLLGCPVRSGDSWSGFALSRETWQLPMRRRDAVLLGLLERHADAAVSPWSGSDAVTDRVRRLLTSRLTDGEPAIESIARALAMSPRTLQRRLAGEGVTFQAVLDSVRREAAERHLQGRALSIAEIAFLLGYSEPAAFHRAFQRWHGTTPQSFRAAMSSPEPRAPTTPRTRAAPDRRRVARVAGSGMLAPHPSTSRSRR
jgi:AraC-like DNA-binding protein